MPKGTTKSEKKDDKGLSVVWYWKKDLRFKDDHLDAWEPYAPSESDRIERAFQKRQKTFSLSETYTIDFQSMIQFRKGDRDRQRDIKRQEIDSDDHKKLSSSAAPASSSVAGSGDAASPAPAPTPAPAVSKPYPQGAELATLLNPGGGGIKRAASADSDDESSGAQDSLRWKWPAKFNIDSGELLWGQLQCLLAGSKEKAHDGVSGPTDNGFGGGTILQSSFRYRCAARVGKWVVERFSMGKDFQVGYVAHHESVTGAELLKMAATTGISLQQQHADRRVVYVNRYDWSFHSGDANEVCALLRGPLSSPMKSKSSSAKKAQLKKKKKKKPAEEEDEEEDDDEDVKERAETLIGARLMVVDAAAFDDARTLLQKKPVQADTKVETFFHRRDGTPTGFHLAMGDTEYELGWLIFSGQKHDQFPNSDELVGIVYDGQYTSLESDQGNPDFRIEGKPI